MWKAEAGAQCEMRGAQCGDCAAEAGDDTHEAHQPARDDTNEGVSQKTRDRA